MKFRALCLLLLLIATVSASAAVSFSTLLATLPTGNYPQAFVVFNGNIAVANTNDNSVSVFVGSCTTTTCTYTPKGPWATGNGPVSIDKGHFRGPGSPFDLVTADINGGTATVLINKGGGKFTASTFGFAANYPKAVVVGDFNGDNYDDFAVVDGANPSAVTVYINTATCTVPTVCEPNFTPHLYALPFSTLSWGIATGKFAGAGNIDLVVANYYSQNIGKYGAAVLLNKRDGTGGFNPPTFYDGGFYAPFPATGHFTSATQNRDDFVISNFGGVARFFHNNGPGTFTLVSAVPDGLYSTKIANAGDLNGDNLDDLVVALFGTGQVQILESGASGYAADPPITVGTSASYTYDVSIDKLGSGINLLVVLNRGDKQLKIYGP